MAIATSAYIFFIVVGFKELCRLLPVWGMLLGHTPSTDYSLYRREEVLPPPPPLRELDDEEPELRVELDELDERLDDDDELR